MNLNFVTPSLSLSLSFSETRDTVVKFYLYRFFYWFFFRKVDRTKILPNILDAIGQTPLVRLNKIPKMHGIKCELCKYYQSRINYSRRPSSNFNCTCDVNLHLRNFYLHFFRSKIGVFILNPNFTKLDNFILKRFQMLIFEIWRF